MYVPGGVFPYYFDPGMAAGPHYANRWAGRVSGCGGARWRSKPPYCEQVPSPHPATAGWGDSLSASLPYGGRRGREWRGLELMVVVRDRAPYYRLDELFVP